MLRYVVCAALLFSGQAWAAGAEPNEILFVRPNTGEYGAEDGTTYADAFDGRAAVLYSGTPGTVGRVDANDTLVVCGEFDEGQWNIGLSAASLIFDGDCSAYGGPVKATLRNTGASGVLVGNATTTWTWRNFIAISDDSDTTAAVRLGNSSTGTFNITIEDFEIYGTASALSSSTVVCLRILGIGMTVDDGVISRCPTDGIYAEGQNHELTDLRITNIDTQTGTDGGDCIQYGDGAGANYDHQNIAVRRLYCENYGVVQKQGVIFGCDNTGGPANANFLLEDSSIYGIQTGAASVYVKYCSGVTIRRNELATIAVGDNSTSQTVTVESNVFMPSRAGVSTDPTNHAAIRWDSLAVNGSLTVRNNSILIDGNYGYGIYVVPSSATLSASLANNVIVGPAINAALRGGTGVVWSSQTNALHGMSTNYFAGGVDETGAGDVSVDPQFVGGAKPATSWGFSLGANSPLVAAGSSCAASDYFGDTYYSQCDIGGIRRDQCYRRSQDGAKSPARTRSQIAERCRGIPGRYPEGL